ncbi:MAG TPA: efflux RND transporter periplasmic adaptor subunit [Moraxellaceae bacterium]|nr:efflux RND transporter periplasmic adaptor subunit [Moraxellaceae bacterium]
MPLNLPVVIRRTLSIGLPLVLLAGGAWWYTRPAPVPVRLATVDQGPVEATVANTRAGTVKACRRSRLSLHSGGRVAELKVKEGDRVRKGDLLLRLESEDREALVAQAQAQVAAAEKREQQACRSADFDQRDLLRSQTLAADKLISAQALDAARTRAASSKDACAAARADLKVAHANDRLADTQRSQTELRAPFDGIVAEVNGEVGEYATPSPPGVPTPPAVDLIDDSCLYVTAPVDEVDAAKLRVGQPARISLDAYRGRTFDGHVMRLAPYVLDLEKQARTVDVDVAFDATPADVRLLAGQSADIEVILSRATLLRLPTEAVQEGNRVLVYDPATRKLGSRQFTPGIGNWTWTGVKDGLHKGDQVVLSLDRKGVAAGARARPAPEKPATAP